MKIIFIHDHPFFKENNQVFSGGGLPSSIWSNYLINFAEMTVISRRSDNLKDKKVLSSLNDVVKFKLTDKYKSVYQLIKNYDNLKSELSLEIDIADVVLVRLPSVLGIIGARLAFSKKKKVWVEVVGNAQESFNNHGSFMGKLYAPFYNRLNKAIIKKANYVSYVTESKLQIDYPHSKNAITTSLSDVIITRIVGSENIDIKRFTSKKIKIGLIGGFDTAYKGQNVLLKALHILPSDIKDNIELYFIGVGDYNWINKLALKLNLESNIKFIGSKPSGEPVLKLLEELSLYIQPSLTEGMPRAVLEAMSVGCPILGSRVGGIPDVVSESMLHDKEDYRTLSQQIEKLFFNRDILIEESKKNLKKIEPYLQTNLDLKRKLFYSKMNKDLLEK